MLADWGDDEQRQMFTRGSRTGHTGRWNRPAYFTGARLIPGVVIFCGKLEFISANRPAQVF